MSEVSFFKHEHPSGMMVATVTDEFQDKKPRVTVAIIVGREKGAASHRVGLTPEEAETLADVLLKCASHIRDIRTQSGL